MKKIIKIGNVVPDTPTFHDKQRGRVYDVSGLAPTLCTKGGGLVPKILEVMDEENHTSWSICTEPCCRES